MIGTYDGRWRFSLQKSATGECTLRGIIDCRRRFPFFVGSRGDVGFVEKGAGAGLLIVGRF